MALAAEVAGGVRTRSGYTVGDCLGDWLCSLRGRSASTVSNYTRMAEHLRPQLGRILLCDLTARQVADVLAEIAPQVSARSLRLIHRTLVRSIRRAEVDGLAGRNVAAVIKLSDLGVTGRPGRPSKSLDLAEAMAVLHAAAGSPLDAYVVLSLLTGARTEELRALQWADVDLTAGVLSVTRSVRDAGKLKTIKSRRRLALPALAVAALKRHKLAQARARREAGELWKEHDLVFCDPLGAELTPDAVRAGFRKITRAAGIGAGWTPRELRHSFVSLLAADGMPVGTIAALAGHTGSRITESVYLHQVDVQTAHVAAFDRLLGR